jgi:hypothetical protein
MMIAVKFQSQNEKNTANIPGYWPWKKIEIRDEDQAVTESSGWTVYTQAQFDEYIRLNKIKLETYYIGKIPNFQLSTESIQSKVDFAQELIERLKKKNISEGINALRGLWMHQRIRALPVTLPGAPTMTIDLMNMVISGDLELACLSLMYTPPDDMTMPFHWLSQARLDWIIAELKLYLGWP